MIKTGQEKYYEISEKLISVKQTNDLLIIKEVLFFCINELRNLILENNSYQDYAVFTLDTNMIFKTNRNETSLTGPDKTITSQGLLAEILNKANIVSGEQISEEIQDYLFEIHAKLSQGNIDIKRDKELLLERLNTLIFTLN
jgi:hypothetical protein